ncbi:MAG: hypothetical protein ACXACW_01460, partial [Candidatus Hodarchaeales archaeon]
MTRQNTKYNGTAKIGAVFNSLFISVNNNTHIKPEPYVPINMRSAQINLSFFQPPFFMSTSVKT